VVGIGKNLIDGLAGGRAGWQNKTAQADWQYIRVRECHIELERQDLTCKHSRGRTRWVCRARGQRSRCATLGKESFDCACAGESQIEATRGGTSDNYRSDLGEVSQQNSARVVSVRRSAPSALSHRNKVGRWTVHNDARG